MWLPLPGPARPGLLTRMCALAGFMLALVGMAATLVIWRADAAAQRGDFARAVRWRPQVGLYHRELGEVTLLTSPRDAEKQLLDAQRLDPYDPLTMADLTTTELATGEWANAVSLTQKQQQREPMFDDYWRLANLFLAHRNLPGFWQEFALAAANAQAMDFGSITSRALTASGNDFTTLRRELPPRSLPAASAFLAAAVAQSNHDAAMQGAAWLQSLGRPANAEEEGERRGAVVALLEAAWRQWPQDASGIWSAAVQNGVLPPPAKTAAPPYLADGGLDPAVYQRDRALAPDPGTELASLIGWSWTSPNGVRFYEVLTGDASHPTAGELLFDGNEGDDLDLTQQWVLLPPLTALRLSAWARDLDGSSAGLSLQVSDRSGHVLTGLPLSTEDAWKASQILWTNPAAAAVQSFRLALHYHRPVGALPLQHHILVTQVELR